MTVITNPYPNVLFPAGARQVDEWIDLGTPSGAFCYSEGARWAVALDNCDDDIEVYVAGTQQTDGSVQREIVVHQLHADEATPGRRASSRERSWPPRTRSTA